MGAYDIITLIIGFCGTLMLFIMYQQNDRKMILLFQIIGASFFSIHFFLLGAYTGSILNAIAVIRAVVYSKRDNKFFGSEFWLWFFIVVSAIAGIFTWQGFESILPIIAMIVGSVSIWVIKPRHIRILSFIPSPMWLTYNIINVSIPGAVTEIFIMTSIAIAIFRYDILLKEKTC